MWRRLNWCKITIISVSLDIVSTKLETLFGCNFIMTQSQELKSSGLKVTLPRLKILDLFQNRETGQRHLSAEDVYRLLIAEDMDIGLATIYRVLTQFEQAGILVRRNFESGKALYELNEGEPHDHLLCLSCGKVIEFNDVQIFQRQAEIAKDYNFAIQERTMTLYGVCSDCQNKQSKR